MSRVYLDFNATTPVRSEARAAMVAAMDLVGNPSSVHAEGRAAKAAIEQSRSRIAQAIDADGADIVFVSGATEGAALACAGRELVGADIEHDAVAAWISAVLPVAADGQVMVAEPQRSVVQLANSETGIIQSLPPGIAVVDMTQAVGKIPVSFHALGCDVALLSAHKFGGPKGIGAVVLRRGLDLTAQIKGGGQEMGRRSGTENTIGIMGFAAALEVATQEVTPESRRRIEKLREILEKTIEAAAKETIFVGKSSVRLPNTCCLATPGWKGETQVMQMDLAGVAVSAGSACSSGKVRASRVLKAMGYDDGVAASAIRVSLGLTTTQDDVLRFCDAWIKAYKRRQTRAA